VTFLGAAFVLSAEASPSSSSSSTSSIGLKVTVPVAELGGFSAVGRNGAVDRTNAVVGGLGEPLRGLGRPGVPGACGATPRGCPSALLVGVLGTDGASARTGGAWR
jgi:hypothetical protein